MKPDPDYLKELLKAFQDSTKPTADVDALASAGRQLGILDLDCDLEF